MKRGKTSKGEDFCCDHFPSEHGQHQTNFFITSPLNISAAHLEASLLYIPLGTHSLRTLFMTSLHSLSQVTSDILVFISKLE